MMRSIALCLLLAVAALEICPAVARGDGGVVRLVEQQGNLRISAFTSPNPLRAGPADVSVLVQNARTGQLVPEAEVWLTLTCRAAPEVALRAAATTEAATNRLLRAALVEIPRAGWWDVNVSCAAEGQATAVRFSMEVAPPLPDWLTVWPWFSWPVWTVIVFGLHRALVFRRHGRRRAVNDARRDLAAPGAGAVRGA
jgi:hypothetical protein